MCASASWRRRPRRRDCASSTRPCAPTASYRIESDFIRCPSCLRKLKERCASCSRPLDQAWTICPYCEADVPGLSSPRSRRRRASANAAPALDGELTDLDIAAVSEETDAEPAEPALATEPARRAPAAPRAPAGVRAQATLERRLPDLKRQTKGTHGPNLILVKPDAFARGLTGEIIARFERKGLRIVALRHMTVTRELAERHYAEHAERPFFGELVDFITSGPIVAMVLEGLDAVKAARQLIGATNPLEAATGSIRGDFAIEMGANMVHGSDSPESAAREAGLFFPEL